MVGLFEHSAIDAPAEEPVSTMVFFSSTMLGNSLCDSPPLAVYSPKVKLRINAPQLIPFSLEHLDEEDDDDDWGEEDDSLFDDDEWGDN